MAKSIEQTMAARLKEIDAEENDDAPEDVETVDAADDTPAGDDTDTPTPDEDVEEPETGARERDEKGRFVPKEAKQDSAPPEGEGSAGATVVAADTPKPEPVEPPHSWSAEDKALFATLPQPAQAAIARRAKEQEADYTRKSQGVAQWNPIEQRHGARAREYGTTTAQLADRLLQTQELLATGTPDVRKAILLSIARDYGVDLAAAPQAQGSAGQIQQDPAMAGIAQVRGELAAFQHSMQQQAQAAALQAAHAQIEAFRDEKKTDGTLAHPHFQALENEILTLVHGARATGQQLTLQEAYARAVWMNQTTRDATIKTEREAAAKKAAADALAARKKNAAKANLPHSDVGTATRAAKGKTFEDTMRMRLAATGYGQDE